MINLFMMIILEIQNPKSLKTFFGLTFFFPIEREHSNSFLKLNSTHYFEIKF